MASSGDTGASIDTFRPDNNFAPEHLSSNVEMPPCERPNPAGQGVDVDFLAGFGTWAGAKPPVFREKSKGSGRGGTLPMTAL